MGPIDEKTRSSVEAGNDNVAEDAIVDGRLSGVTPHDSGREEERDPADSEELDATVQSGGASDDGRK